MIKEIRFEGMLPEVFQNERIPESDVWKTGLVLERGEHYLIEAASGGGKSSMCSYIFGSRDDYKGKLLFDSRDVREFTISDWQEIRRRNICLLYTSDAADE